MSINKSTSVDKLYIYHMVNLETAEHFECRASEIWREEDELFIKIKYGTELKLADVEEMAKTTEGIWRGAQILILTDIRGLKSISKRARIFSSSNNAEFRENVAASAILIGNPISTTIGNIILRIDQPPFPTRLFTKLETAEEWLAEFKSLHA